MNSYQRLKQKNKKLGEDYRELFNQFVKVLEDPNSEESKKIKCDILQRALLFKMPEYYFTNLLAEMMDHDIHELSTFKWDIMDRNDTTEHINKGEL